MTILCKHPIQSKNKRLNNTDRKIVYSISDYLKECEQTSQQTWRRSDVQGSLGMNKTVNNFNWFRFRSDNDTHVIGVTF